MTVTHTFFFLLASIVLFDVPVVRSSDNVSTDPLTAVTECQTAAKEGTAFAVQACRGALSLDLSGISDAERVEIYFSLVEGLGFRGDYQEALTVLEKLERRILRVNNDASWRYRWYRQYGLMHYRLGDLNTALATYERALQLAKARENIQWLGRSYNDMAFLNKAKGRYEDALSNAFSSLGFKREADDQLGAALTLGNIADVYRALEDGRTAIDYYQQAVDQIASLSSQSTTSTVPKLMAITAHLQESAAAAMVDLSLYDQALDALNSALVIFKEREDIPAEIRVLTNIGNAHLSAGQTTNAQSVLLEALSLELSLEQPVSINLRRYLGNLYLALGEPSIAKTYAAVGLQLARDEDRLDILPDFFVMLAIIEERENRYASALLYQQQYIKAREAWLAQKYNDDIRQLTAEIELSEKSLRLVTTESENRLKQSTIARQRAYLIALVLAAAIIIAYGSWILSQRRARQVLLEREIEHHRLVFEQLSVAAPQQPSISGGVSSNGEPDQPLRSVLAKVMILSVESWELTTRSSRIELAEKSRIWKVTIDDGRLRTRTLDRYLEIDKLPVRPRVRSVIQTCHFVLAECNLSAEQREALNAALNSLLTITRQTIR